MTEKNTVLFLFTKADRKSEFGVTFTFGEYKTNSVCYDYNWKIPEQGIANFNQCPFPLNDKNNFNFDCDCDGSNPPDDIYFDNVTSYFGTYSYSNFSIEFSSTISHFGYSSNITDIYIPDLRISGNIYVGYNASANKLIINHEIKDTFTFGINSTSFVIFDRKEDFFGPGEYADSRYGYDVTNKFVFNPYNELLKGENAESSFGYDVTNKFVFNPYNELLKGENAESSFGLTLNNKFVFNPYNELLNSDNPAVSVFGYSANSSIRYSDDQTITKEALFGFGIESKSDMKYINNYAYISSTQYYGINSESNIIYTTGFIGSSYFGYNSKLRYIVIGNQYTTFDNCIVSFGYHLHDNNFKPRWIDLSDSTCCSIKILELKHVEMMDYDDWDVRYGLEHGWGYSSFGELQTQPRFKATVIHGFESKVIDPHIDLGTWEFGIGFKGHTRGIRIDSTVDLVDGNFIVTDDEIKIELTKPNDVADINYEIYAGLNSSVLFGISAGLRPYSAYYGQELKSDLQVLEALRGRFHFGVYSRFSLNYHSVLHGTSQFGISSRAQFYEQPYHMYIGFNSTCDGIITENWVEFLEEGEIDNEYIYQNENGDPDLDRPNGESIEGYEYIHYIRGRCF